MTFQYALSESYRTKTLSRSEGFQMVLDGRLFINSLVATGLGSGLTAYYGIFTGNKTTLITSFTFSANVGPMTVRLYENPTVTSVGTVNPSYSLNRNISAVEDTVIASSTLVSANGTNIWSRLFQGGKEGTAGGAQMAIVLKPNTPYLFTVTNGSNQADSHSMEWSFIET